MRGIHQTLTDEDGVVYHVTPKNERYITIVMLGAILLGMTILLVIAVTNRTSISKLQDEREVQRQRNLATDEMLLRRANVQKWTYEMACEYAKTVGKKCLENPQWWADRNKYPALVADPDAQGSGLFPRDSQ